ncbi:hypothetical protein LWI29_024018 [Acer saccharum]|uniref:Uncharacterized protein n=1 Tax=Acer saccharum TaxID=4024 RepID=A0AA39VTZ4_ACESA|nr:hypothetical protein LWI29_024018 [Acer saccharum]
MAYKEITDLLTASIESVIQNATVETGLEEDAAATETGSPSDDDMNSFHLQLVERVSVLEKTIAELKAKTFFSQVVGVLEKAIVERVGVLEKIIAEFKAKRCVSNKMKMLRSARSIDPAVLDPCKLSGGSAPGCGGGGQNKQAPPQQANEYSHGCSSIHHCRHG